MTIYSYLFSTIYFSSTVTEAEYTSRPQRHIFELLNPSLELSKNGLDIQSSFLLDHLNDLISMCDDLSICILLEIFDCIAPFNLDKIIKILHIFDSIIKKHDNLFVRKKCIKFQLHCGFPGIDIQLQYCNDDVNPIGNFILSTLVEEPLVQSSIIMPSLLNNFHLSDIRARSASLSALS